MTSSTSSVADMVRDAERHADDMAHDRIRATEYYQGKMEDATSESGRSSVVMRELRSHIKKVLPSISRTILGSDEIVEFLPVGPGDEEGADQASDYLNYEILPKTKAQDAIYSAIHDALLLRNGILRWWYEERQKVEISRHTGLTESGLAEIASDDEVEILESNEVVEEINGAQVSLYDVKIRRTYVDARPRCAAVPRERFLIHPDATCIEDSLITGEKSEVRRSDLIQMGYPRDVVDNLPIATEDDTEEDIRRDMAISGTSEAFSANDLIDYYDIYVRVDLDGDGISELRHMCYAGGLSDDNLLLNEPCDDVQYCDIAVMRQPHQWEGVSLSDDLMELQRVKTVLARQTLDNLYWQNNPQPVVNGEAITDMEAVYSPEFGKPIVTRAGHNVRDAIQFSPVPFVAKESFGMLEYIDREAQDRTGISDASAGLAPDALQNMTATASAIIEQQGIGQTEFMVKTVADGLRVFFRGLLRLIIRHQDAAKIVRLRDQFIEIDPRHWNAGMDCKVNTGLGAGTRERDMAMMQIVMNVQKEIFAAFGPDNAFVKAENLHNTLSKFVEAAGLKTPSLYFSEPDPAEVQASLEAARNAPDPEVVKIQAKAQADLEAKKLDVFANTQAKKAEMEAAASKEREQRDADLIVEQKRLESDIQKAQADAVLKRQLEADKLSFEREKLDREERLRREEMAFQAQMKALEVSGRPNEGESAPEFNQGAAFLELAKSITAPKVIRVERDENGDIVGGTSAPVLN